MSCLAFLAFGYLWGLSALFGFRGAAIFNREEADGTLYRVLATKRGGELLLRRKVKGLWRLFRILFVPYAILVLVQAFTMMHGAGGAGRSLATQLEASATWTAIPERLSLEAGFAALKCGRFARETLGPAQRDEPLYWYTTLTTRF